MDPQGNFYTGYDELPEALHGKILPSFFPPTNVESLGLEKW
jgi:hypothetical protein